MKESLARAVQPLTDERRTAAETLLDAADLLDQAEQAMTGLGYVGETVNKKLVYLVAVSRLMPKPLSAILFAASGAGKSELLDTLARLLPSESVEFLSKITPSALFYAGEEALKHKAIIVDEQAGTADADHSIRTLQTKGLLRLAIPVKGKTQAFTARGPIALLSGTTRSDLNPENLSRCLELSLDDGPEQTRRIQEAQRRAAAGRNGHEVPVELWRDAQQVLEALEVLVPYAERLDYPARTTKDRRDNQKLLTLIQAHALLHQRSRERDGEGRLLATVADYAAIHALVEGSLAPRVEGLSARAADLYRHLAEDGEPVNRREVMAAVGTSYMTAKRLLEELIGQELVRRVPGDDWPRRYKIIDRSLVGVGATLTLPEALREQQPRPRRASRPRSSRR